MTMKGCSLSQLEIDKLKTNKIVQGKVIDSSLIRDSMYINMKMLNFKVFMKKYSLKNDTMNESDLNRVYIYIIYPRDSKIYSDEGFVFIDEGSQGGTHWTCFIVEDNKSYYFDSFGGQPDKRLLNQLHNPIIYQNCKIQDKKSQLCRSYCLYFFYLIERMIL